MTQDIEIPKISQKHLLGIKYLSVDDINRILELAIFFKLKNKEKNKNCLLYTSPSPRDGLLSRMPSSA